MMRSGNSCRTPGSLCHLPTSAPSETSPPAHRLPAVGVTRAVRAVPSTASATPGSWPRRRCASGRPSAVLSCWRPSFVGGADLTHLHADSTRSAGPLMPPHGGQPLAPTWDRDAGAYAVVDDAGGPLGRGSQAALTSQLGASGLPLSALCSTLCMASPCPSLPAGLARATRTAPAPGRSHNLSTSMASPRPQSR